MLQLKQASAKRRGATVVETAAVISIFMVLLFGILEYCMILYTYGVMQNAAREGARYAVANSTDATLVSDTQAYVQTMMMSLDTKLTGYSCSVYLANSSGVNINSGSTDATSATFEQNICVDVKLTYVPVTPGLIHLSTFTLESKCCMGSEAN